MSWSAKTIQLGQKPACRKTRQKATVPTSSGNAARLPQLRDEQKKSDTGKVALSVALAAIVPQSNTVDGGIIITRLHGRLWLQGKKTQQHSIQGGLNNSQLDHERFRANLQSITRSNTTGCLLDKPRKKQRGRPADLCSRSSQNSRTKQRFWVCVFFSKR